MSVADQFMSGKMCLITGATAGIGLVTARELARRGARVVVLGRSPERCRAAVDAIVQATGNTAVEFIAADLSSQAQVRRAAADFLARHDRLHVLINNAGAFFALRSESVDDIEMTLALNHLAPFLLTNLLLDALKASAPARVINVSSDAHEMVKGFDFGDPGAAQPGSGYGRSETHSLLYALLGPRAHPGLRQYARTKLANILFTTELARRLQGSGVTANALHPGFVATSFTAGNGAYGWFMRRLSSLLAVSPDQGAATSIALAAAPELETVSGRYFVKGVPATPSPAAQDPAAALRLWELSELLTRK